MAPLSTGGFDPRHRPVVLHDCGKKVRLGAGYCRACSAEFDGLTAQVVA